MNLYIFWRLKLIGNIEQMWFLWLFSCFPEISIIFEIKRSKEWSSSEMETFLICQAIKTCFFKPTQPAKADGPGWTPTQVEWIHCMAKTDQTDFFKNLTNKCRHEGSWTLTHDIERAVKKIPRTLVVELLEDVLLHICPYNKSLLLKLAELQQNHLWVRAWASLSAAEGIQMGGSIGAGEIHFSSEFIWREGAGVPIRTPSFFLSFYHYFCILMIIYVPEKHKEENKNNIL